MKIIDINPFIRFASTFYFNTTKSRYSYVYDCRIIYVIQGEITIHINHQDIRLEKDGLFYCCGNNKYIIKTKNKTKLHALNFDLTTKNKHITTDIPIVSKKEFKKENVLENDEITDSSILNSYGFIENAVSLQSKIIRIIDEFSKHKVFYIEKTSAMLKDLIIDIHRELTFGISTSFSACDKVIEFIKQNYSQPISNKTLAKLTNYHEYYLNKLFVKQTGLNMHQYLLRYRLNKAKVLLVSTSLPLEEIAFETGFCSASHFSYCFKKEFLQSPSKYRNLFTV